MYRRGELERKQGATLMSYLSFGAEEWGCCTQLFFYNASTLLGLLAAIFNMTFFGVPVGVINKVGYTVSWLKSVTHTCVLES